MTCFTDSSLRGGELVTLRRGRDDDDDDNDDVRLLLAMPEMLGCLKENERAKGNPAQKLVFSRSQNRCPPRCEQRREQR